MCDICKALIDCPIGEKRTVIIQSPENEEVIDAYGHTLTIGPVKMFVDKYKDHADAGIFQDVKTEDSVQYGGGFAIKNCPLCGQKIV